MKTFRWVALLFLSGVMVSCVPASDGPVMAASRSMNCPVDSLSVREISKHERDLLALVGGPTTEVALGCGKAEAFAHMCSVQSDGAAPVCAWYSVSGLKARDLRKRAAFDANCPPGQLALNEIDDSTTGVLGCGQRLSYTWSCPHNARLFSGACHWVLGASTTPQAPAAPGPTPAGPAPAPSPASPAPHATEI